MVRGNVHKVTEVFWPKKYCALKALSEMLFVLEEKFIIRAYMSLTITMHALNIIRYDGFCLYLMLLGILPM